MLAVTVASLGLLNNYIQPKAESLRDCVLSRAYQEAGGAKPRRGKEPESAGRFFNIAFWF